MTAAPNGHQQKFNSKYLQSNAIDIPRIQKPPILVQMF